jgi:hypothetical protein
MDMQVVPLPTVAQLREYVRQKLCDRDRLDPEQVHLREGLIEKHGRACGLFFQVQGPRLLRTYAVWAADEFRILFYDSTGERFGEARLSEAPDASKDLQGTNSRSGAPRLHIVPSA